MFEEGFISIDRKIVNWEWYKDSSTKALFLHLLLLPIGKTEDLKDMKFHVVL